MLVESSLRSYVVASSVPSQGPRGHEQTVNENIILNKESAMEPVGRTFTQVNN